MSGAVIGGATSARDGAAAAAKQLEVDGRKFYLEAAERTSSNVLEKVFRA